MTTLETKALAPGDRVMCGKHVGRVVGVAPFTVSVEWQPGLSTVHDRARMSAIRRAEATPVVYHQDTLDTIRQAENPDSQGRVT